MQQGFKYLLKDGSQVNTVVIFHEQIFLCINNVIYSFLVCTIGLSDPYCLVALVNKGMSAGDSNSLQHSTSVPSDQSEASTGKFA